MFSANGRGGGEGREGFGVITRAPLRWQFWRRKALLLVLCAGESLPQQSLAFGCFTLPRGVHVALPTRPRLPSRGHKGEQGYASVLGAFSPIVHVVDWLRKSRDSQHYVLLLLDTKIWLRFKVKQCVVVVDLVLRVGQCLVSLSQPALPICLAVPRCLPPLPCDRSPFPTLANPPNLRCFPSSSTRCRRMSHERESSRQADSLAGGVHGG